MVEKQNTNHFDYYYGAEGDQFSFIRIPKTLLNDEEYSSLSIIAKLLYGLLLDRMSLSRKSGWLDEENRVYIIYQIAEIQDNLGVSNKKAIDLLAELEKFGLVEKKRRGLGLPSILYVKNFIKKQNETVETTENSGNDESFTSRSVDSGTSGSEDSTLQKVSKPTPLISNTNTTNTYSSKTESNPISSTQSNEPDSMDEMRAYATLIKENIEYDSLLAAYPRDAETVEGFFDLILETILSKADTIHVAGSPYPKELVKSKFLKLDFTHLRYIIDSFFFNTTKVANIKKYMLAMLFNAPSTIGSYYLAEANHDTSQNAFD